MIQASEVPKPDYKAINNYVVSLMIPSLLACVREDARAPQGEVNPWRVTAELDA